MIECDKCNECPIKEECDYTDEFGQIRLVFAQKKHFRNMQ